MKISYTYDEAIGTLRDSVVDSLRSKGLEYNVVTVDIVTENTSTMHHLAAYAKVVDKYDDSRFSSDKIPAIKMMHQLIPGLSLTEAKRLVEANPYSVLKHFHARQTLVGYVN